MLKTLTLVNTWFNKYHSFLCSIATGTMSSTTRVASPDERLLREIKYLRSDLIRSYQLLDNKENIIRQLQTTNNFTDDEISFILMRCHPDHNPESNIATKLTQKLLSKRKKV